MSSELAPNPKYLMADADRERVVARLHAALGEGRLTLAEFEDRMGGVLAARTFGDVEPYVADLPADPVLAVAVGKPLDLYVRGSRIAREGRWAVPAEMRIDALGASVRLDFTQAVLASTVVTMAVDLHGTGMRLILPDDATVDADAVSLNGSTVKLKGIDRHAQPGRLHIVITGYLRGSTIRAGRPRQGLFRRGRSV
jgi:hypothetical protein